jgi:hypothetical protein
LGENIAAVGMAMMATKVMMAMAVKIATTVLTDVD